MTEPTLEEVIAHNMNAMRDPYRGVEPYIMMNARIDGHSMYFEKDGTHFMEVRLPFWYTPQNGMIDAFSQSRGDRTDTTWGEITYTSSPSERLVALPRYSEATEFATTALNRSFGAFNRLLQTLPRGTSSAFPIPPRLTKMQRFWKRIRGLYGKN